MSMWDDDRSDPKHPDWAGSMLDRADYDRKRRAESSVREPSADDLRRLSNAADRSVAEIAKLGSTIKTVTEAFRRLHLPRTNFVDSRRVATRPRRG